MAKETIVPKCDYCIHNEGEDNAVGFMWHCKLLGYCVPFGYRRRHSAKEPLQHCKAIFTQKGFFELDEVKYRENKAKKK